MLQLSQRPLTGSDADQRLFVNRTAELGYLERAVDLDFNVLLLGERGVGLTSLVRRCERHLNDKGYQAFYVNAGRSGGLADLLKAVRITVLGTSVPAQTVMAPLLAWHRVLTGDDREPDSLRLLRSLSQELSNTEYGQLVIILDEMYKPNLAHELFGRYRDEVWQLPFQWLVCGLVTRRSQYLEPPADAFFDSVLTVDRLDDAASRDLLHTRLAAASVDDADATMRILSECDRIVEQGAGNPRQILAVARDTVLRSPEEAASADRLLHTAAALGATEKLAVRHLFIHGPTSASDSTLLESLDITRARATQVLRRLEEAGLVHGFHDKGGVGRPRKLYATRLSQAGAE